MAAHYEKRISFQSINGGCDAFLRYLADARGRIIELELEFDPTTGTPAPHFHIIEFLLQMFRFLKMSAIAREETQIPFAR